MMSRVLVTGINSKYTHSNLALRYFREYSGADIFECSINDNIFDVYSKLIKMPYEILCFSCYIWNIDYTLRLISMLHETVGDKKIFLGGPEAGYNYENLITNEAITGIIRGEGEEPVKALCESAPYSDIPNLVYKKDEQIIINKLRKFDLEKAVFPYSITDLDILKNRIVYFETSRGCMYGCSYCLSSSEGKTRYFSDEYVKNGLKFFMDNRVPLVKLVDRTFNDDNNRSCKIVRCISENNISTKFHFEISPLLLTDEFLSECEKLGENVQFELGIQTVNPDTMRAIHRMYDHTKIKEKILKIPKSIHVHLDLIAGLPNDTFESFLNGFDYVYSMKPDMLQLGFLKLLHNTELKRDADKYEIKTTTFPPYEVLSTSTVSANEMARLKNMEKAVDRVYNSGAFRNTLLALDCEKMSDVFLKIGDKLSEKESEGPVSRTDLYEFLYNIFGDKIKLSLALDFMEANRKINLPKFLNEEIPDLRRIHKEIHRLPKYRDKKIRIVKTCGKYFAVTDSDITEFTP